MFSLRLRPARIFAIHKIKLWCWLSLFAATGGSIPAYSAPSVPKGLPLTRSYAYEEIGNLGTGTCLSFDSFGRLIAFYKSEIAILNDDVWIDVSPAKSERTIVRCVAVDQSGLVYYGGYGRFGRVAQGPDGHVQLMPDSDSENPEWVRKAIFTEVVCKPEGVYFQSDRGIVLIDRNVRKTYFIECPDMARLFFLGKQPYISSFYRGMFELDLGSKTLRPADAATFDAQVVTQIATLPNEKTIVATVSRGLYMFDGRRLEPLPGPWGGRAEGPVEAMHTLSDGNIAVAVTGKGLYILSPKGEILDAFTAPEYRQISALASNEPDILWAATETGVVKIFYGMPVRSLGQASGLHVSWPQLVTWNNQTIIASHGRVFEPESVPSGEPTHFRQMPDQPRSGCWGIATVGDWLLLANDGGVFARTPTSDLQPIMQGFAVGKLVALRSGVCLAIGASEIAALVFEEGEWRECAPRIPGVGYPAKVLPVGDSCWVEIAPNHVARLSLADGRLVTRVFDRFPWSEPLWIHVSTISGQVVLCGGKYDYLYYDDATDTLSEHSEIEKILEKAPFHAARFVEDNKGVIWASHDGGVFTLSPHDGGYTADTKSYSFIAEDIPTISVLPGPQIWMSTGWSLQQIGPNYSVDLSSRVNLQFVSILDSRTNQELLPANWNQRGPMYFAYRNNSFALRLFSGTYAFRRALRYQFKCNGSVWNRLDPSTRIQFSNLREGRYELSVQATDDRGFVGAETVIAFVIEPPWFRSWTAYFGYLLIAIIALVGLLRFLLRRARVRNRELESVVAERTAQLTATMQKLEQETRTAATHAERNRLAGEIHDSLEQGFSALVFQLETVASLPGSTPSIQSGLSVACNMVKFCRNELRHVLWGLHSQLLEAEGLESALQRIVTQLDSGSMQTRISIEGEARPLGPAIEHNLLRVAQEVIANTAKHSSAHNLHVCLSYGPGRVRLCISDDGHGFDAKQLAPVSGLNGHFGIRSMRTRVAKIGGSLEIDSRPGAGTRVTVDLATPNFPLQAI